MYLFPFPGTLTNNWTHKCEILTRFHRTRKQGSIRKRTLKISALVSHLHVPSFAVIFVVWHQQYWNIEGQYHTCPSHWSSSLPSTCFFIPFVFYPSIHLLVPKSCPFPDPHRTLVITLNFFLLFWIMTTFRFFLESEGLLVLKGRWE